MAFAQEGVSNNPTSFEILFTLGELNMERGRVANNGSIVNPGTNALRHFLAARDAYEKAAEYALQQRPANWVDDPKKPSSTWNNGRDTDTLGSFNMAVITENKFGDPQKASVLAKRFREIFPDDGMLGDFIHPPR